MKTLLLSALLLFAPNAFATEITPTTLIGLYKVEAKVLFQKFYGDFRVTNSTEFEFQRTYPDGKKDENCQGTYTLNNSYFLITDSLLASGKTFKGLATCPSDRSKKMELSIDFEDTSVEDLVRGTTLKVRTSLGGGVRLNAYVKKQ